MLSLEDAILSVWGQRVRRLIAAAVLRLERRRMAQLGALAIRLAQWRAERSHSRVRKALLKMDQHIGKMLAFSGTQE